jgi:hypothetical protein
MTMPQLIELTPLEAAGLIEHNLHAAEECLQSSQMDGIQDELVSALGLALQLGPAAVESVLLYVMHAVGEPELHKDSEALSSLGPALIDLVSQVRSAGALPATRIMEAWAIVAADVATIIGQVGLALSITPEHRQGMMANARIRAATLDEATGARFALTDWIDQISGDC